MRIEVSPARIRILAGDDEPLFRDAVARVVRQRSQFELVAEVDDGRDALEAIDRLRPDVAILSQALTGIDGERVLNAVVRDDLPTRIVLLTDRDARDVAYRALESGAACCLTKATTADQLCQAITTAARGGIYVGDELHRGLAGAIRLRSRDERPVLSPRERDVVKAMADGCTNGEIAARLRIAPTTVKTHVAHLFDKLGVSDRAAAVAEAMRRALLE